jgi:hypothetical protein
VNCTVSKDTCSETCLRSLTVDQCKEGWKKAGGSTIDFILANWEHLIDVSLFFSTCPIVCAEADLSFVSKQGAVMQFAPVVSGAIMASCC